MQKLIFLLILCTILSSCARNGGTRDLDADTELGLANDSLIQQSGSAARQSQNLDYDAHQEGIRDDLREGTLR
jgi:hypothetical protein